MVTLVEKRCLQQHGGLTDEPWRSLIQEMKARIGKSSKLLLIFNEKNVSNGNEDWLQAASTAVVLRNKKGVHWNKTK